MTNINLNELTVLELRKVAKEMKVPLSAGISKAGIIERLSAAMADRAPEESPAPEADAPAQEEAVEETEADTPEESPEEKPAAPQFKQAYVAPQRFNNRPAYQAAPYGRQSAQRTPAPLESQRTQTTRPAGFQSRFGPTAQLPQPEPLHDEERPLREDRPRQEAPRSAFGPARSAANDSSRFQQRPAYEQPRQPAYEQRPAYDQPRQPSYEQRPAYGQPRTSGYEQRPAYEASRQGSYDRPQYDRPAYPQRQSYNQEASPFSVNPTASEIMQSVDCPEVTGYLELLPEGYGFLRSESMIASARDVYVSQAQVRRFGLRSGDRIIGRMRPQRDGDKYPALLVVSEVNGAAPEEAAARPSFDSLTPIYPTRRINLERKDAPQLSDLRLMDLITPIGFGQRGLIQCAPHTGKTRLLTRLANVISLNHPEAEVMMLLFNETPENVTVIRESVKCPVVATTFDMAPENHLRLADLIIERAQRLVEMKKDVVLLVDSLTTLIRIISTTAMQAGRAVPGMISPQSLQKAKRLFGAARCIREGGSLTVIATMNTDSGVKADDSVVGEFRGAANMELVLDQGLARAGVYPPLDLMKCGTRRAEAILTPEHIEGLKLIKTMLNRLPAETAVKELLSMLDKAATNEELLSRIKVWAASMQG